jgi:hypothetical protein
MDPVFKIRYDEDGVQCLARSIQLDRAENVAALVSR